MTVSRTRRPSDSHHAGIGDLVDGRYRIEGVLGRGTWSVVYRATAQRTGHPIALKMLLRGLPCGDEAAEQRFFREAQITAALQHPNTLRVFDVGRTSGGALYIASERLQGPTLEEELQKQADRGRPMSEAEVLEVADAVLRSLAEAHDRGMVHRDLKPANIVLHTVAGERVVKVLDFGIASLQGDRMTPRGVSLGTPDYMSPEQCARQDLDGRSDLYALGVILFRAVSGHVPFIGEDVFVVMQHHRETIAPDVRSVAPHVSEAIASLIDRALAKHPDERFHDARAMREAVVRAARDLSVQPRLRSMSSTHIPRVVITQAPTNDTGSWRVSAQDPVSAATQMDTGKAGRVRSTSKYGMVTEADLEAHRTRGPDLRRPPSALSRPFQVGDLAAASVSAFSPHASLRPTVATAVMPEAELMSQWQSSAAPIGGDGDPEKSTLSLDSGDGAKITVTLPSARELQAPLPRGRPPVWPWLALIAAGAVVTWLLL